MPLTFRWQMVDHVPNCGEMLSVAIIITECSFVAYLSLLQSCLVLYLHHRERLCPAVASTSHET